MSWTLAAKKILMSLTYRFQPRLASLCLRRQLVQGNVIVLEYLIYNLTRGYLNCDVVFFLYCSISNLESL